MRWLTLICGGLVGLAVLTAHNGARGAEPEAVDGAATEADQLESAVEQLDVPPRDRTALRVVLDPRKAESAPAKKPTEVRVGKVQDTTPPTQALTLGEDSAIAEEPDEAAVGDEAVDTETPSPQTASDEDDAAAEDEAVAADTDDTAAKTSEVDSAQAAPADVKPLEAPAPPQDLATPEISPRLQELRAKVRRVLGWYFHRNLNTRDHNPWEMMHGVIAYGCDTRIHRGGPDGPRVNGISWLSVNGECHGIRLLTINRRKEIDAQVGQYVQGHPGQLLAILAQCHVPQDYPMSVNQRPFTMRDLIETEMKSCEAGTELTFKLIGLSHYLDTESTWKDHRGGTWSIARLIQEEIKQPILYTAACGGTHRLMGLSYCNFKRVKEGRPIDGQFARAKKYVQDYHRYAFALQNPDGSFSTDWFKGRQNKPDNDRKLKTTGHILEWLAFSLPEEQLTDPRMVRAVEFIAGILDEGHGHKWEIGPIGHSLHALRIYDRRLFKPLDPPPAAEPTAPLAEVASEAPQAEVAAKPRTVVPAPSAAEPGQQPAEQSANDTKDDAPDDAGEPANSEADEDSGDTPVEDEATISDAVSTPVDSTLPAGASVAPAPATAQAEASTATQPAPPATAKASQPPAATKAATSPPAAANSGQALQFKRQPRTQANPFRQRGDEPRVGNRPGQTIR